MRVFPDYSSPEMSRLGSKKAGAADDDDDTEKDGVKPKPDLRWEDAMMQGQILDGLNQMRRNKHFCDVILQIGKRDYFAHRAVLAAASPYLMDLFNSAKEQPTRKEIEGSSGIVYQLNGGFEKNALEKLIEYAYTSRLDISGEEVKSIYIAAVRLRMERVARQCADFLTAHMDLETCLEIRALPGVARMKDLVKKVDAFIDENLEALRSTQPLLSLDRICIEVLHNCKKEQDFAQARSLCQLVLDWIHNQWLEDEKLTLTNLKEKTHLLYVAKDNGLQDCEEIEEGSENDSDIIQDYKKTNQQLLPKKTSKVKRHSQMKPTKPRELLFSRHINQDENKTEDNVDDWKVISCTTLEGVSILGLITIDGNLFSCSIIQRLNRPSSPHKIYTLPMLPSNNDVSVRSRSKPSRTPLVAAKASSGESSDVFSPVATMNQAKCAGTACVNGELVVCGGFDRGQCLNTVCRYNPKSNQWTMLQPMLAKRGRFDVAVRGDFIYAVAGSSGQTETNTAEKYDVVKDKWKFIANLPNPVSNIGLCELDGAIYCIGGSFGQSGNKHCYRLNDEETKWERIASLSVGRSQAGVTSFQGKIWVVGGCDAWNPLCTVEIYDPASNTWKSGPPMNSPRRGCGLVAKPNLLYVIGGSDGTQSLCTTEVYDPRINLWVVGPNMTVCRGNVSASLVEDKIWAVGGFSGKVFLNTMEYLDPAREEWTTFFTSKAPTSASSSEEKSAIIEVSENGDTHKVKFFVNGLKTKEEEEAKVVMQNGCSAAAAAAANKNDTGDFKQAASDEVSTAVEELASSSANKVVEGVTDEESGTAFPKCGD